MQPAPYRRRQLSCLLLGTSVAALCLGCADVFSPSFLQLFGANGQGLQTINPPAGHVPIIFRNSARISDDVFRFLIQGDTVVRQEVIDEIRRVNPGASDQTIDAILQNILADLPTSLEELDLPPRVRLTVDVLNANGGTQRLEMLSGLRLLRGEEIVGGGQGLVDLPPDLTENSNDTFIVQCEIESIQIVQVDVYIPVVVRLMSTQVVVDINGVPREIDVCEGFDGPQFDVLEEDADFETLFGTFAEVRNYDPRMFPPALSNIGCGGVVVIELSGDLTLPFKDVPNDCEPTVNPPDNGRAPAWFIDTMFGFEESIRIPGRYALTISVRDQ